MASTTDSRRFGGVGRLYGEDGAAVLSQSHVVVVGVGGVGSWAVEALARTGVGRLTLIDGDTVAVSNTNRQLHALDGNYGKRKVDAMKERIALINPACRVEVSGEFVTSENVDELVPADADVVLDCIDDIRGKTALVAAMVRRGTMILVSGGAAARTDPGRLETADLAFVRGDPLLAKIRTNLRKEHGFPRGDKAGRSRRFGVTAVFSEQPLRQPGADSLQAVGADPTARIGFGSGIVVTASCGLRLAALAINSLVSQNASEDVK